MGMPSSGLSLFLGLLGLYAVVSWFSKTWAEAVTGYERGNRYRMVAIVKLEITMGVLNIFVYKQLMQWFTVDDMKHYGKCASTRRTRERVSCALLLFIFLAHAVYAMYYVPPWMQWLFFDLTTIACGVWTNVLAFVCGFFLVNVFIGPLNKIQPFNWLFAQIARVSYLKGLMYDRREQIKFTLWFSCLLSLLMWYGCDKIVVKERQFHIPNYTGEKPLKFAVISDIHAGASVYRDQVERVVDAVLPLTVDAVLIVGDMVDGEASELTDRVSPMFALAQRFPTFFVTGNHDYYYGNVQEWIDLYEKHGIRVLTNNATNFHGICLAGASDIASHKAGIRSQEMNISLSLSHCPPVGEASRVLLAHNPASVREITREDMPTIDLMISGHTHAGQFYVVIPAVYWMLPYFYGVYDLPAPSTHGKLMVTAGSLYQGPPMKMLGMSEVWVVTLNG
ncbi:unnamed protein product, partial [Mesorhabditis spiculigera]